MRPNTKTFFLESPTNPTLEVIDIAAVAEIAHDGRRDAGGRQRVRDADAARARSTLGADCVVYSATKHIDGQGRCLGGVILGSEKFIQDNVHDPVPPDRAVAVAVQRLGDAEGAGDAAGARASGRPTTAATVAAALAEHPKITRLIYPGRAGPSAGRDRASGR